MISPTAPFPLVSGSIAIAVLMVGTGIWSVCRALADRIRHGRSHRYVITSR